MSIKAIVFLAGVAGLVAYIFMAGIGSSAWISEGSRAPIFTVHNLEGEEISLSDLRGRVVFLNFWRTDCPPCAREMPDLELLAKKFAGRKFEMMAVSLDANPNLVERFYRERNLTMPAYVDPHWNVADKYNIKLTPESFVIDSTGKVAKYYIGPMAWTSPEILAMLEGMIPR